MACRIEVEKYSLKKDCIINLHSHKSLDKIYVFCLKNLEYSKLIDANLIRKSDKNVLLKLNFIT